MALRDPSLVPDKSDQKGLIDYFVTSLGTAAGIPIAIVLIYWFFGSNISALIDAHAASIKANETQLLENAEYLRDRQANTEQDTLYKVEYTRYWKARADKESAP